MKTIIFKNFHLLDGTPSMKDKVINYLEVKDGKITNIGDFDIPNDVEVIDLEGKYLLPGLINLHSHLPASGKMGKKKLGDASKLVKLILSNSLFKKFGLLIEKKAAVTSLNSGVTTVRTVGGVGDIDSILRDKINSGKILGPRLIVSNTAIGVPGGHMDGTVAKGAASISEARQMVRDTAKSGADLIKLMITGGVLDGDEIGKPAKLRMKPEMVKACCDEAHKLGLKVAAHVESEEGIRVAIENGVDSVEHGADFDDELANLLKERDGAVVVTISPAIPLSTLPADATPYGEIGKANGKVVCDGIIKGGKNCVEKGIKVGLGTDAGSSLVTHYNFWRELQFFVKHCKVSPKFALSTATLGNAVIAGIDKETGSIEVGKDADILIVDSNPLENNFRSLSKPYMVMTRGKLLRKPSFKRMEEVDNIIDSMM